jgi:hypothetical protein
MPARYREGGDHPDLRANDNGVVPFDAGKQRRQPMMDITRNQFFFAGILCLFVGIEFRMVDSFELNPELTQFLAVRTGHPLASVNATTQSLTASEKPLAKKTVRPPDWIGWMLISLGSVLVLHSWGMKKPGT